MNSETQVYNKATVLINNFANSDKAPYQHIITDKSIHYAIGLLEDSSGIARTDQKLAKLCADCFMFGVYIATQKNGNGISLSEQELAKRCLQCDSIEYKSGALRCKLINCKYE